MQGIRSLSPQARAYIWAILGLGAATYLSGLSSPPYTGGEWLVFAFLVAAAATAQLFPVVGPKNEAYQLTFAFVFAGVLLLPPGALATLIVMAFIPEWLKYKYAWYLQLFNIGNVLVDAFLAKGLYILVAGSHAGDLTHPTSLIAAVLAAALLTFLNRLLLAIVLHLARGHTWREAGLFEPGSFLIDGTLACIGIITALLWKTNPLLVSLTTAPLFLIYRALNTPNLQEQARTDSKTGLYNARHFGQVLQEEIRRASRFDRPLTVIMADLDLLRDINNAYGHLAGDVVLRGVADIVKSGLREYDVAARFGGEEFAILLPECEAAQGLAVAERLRRQVESARFPAPTSAQPLRATLSLGIASFPAHGRDADEVVHQADLAVYYAKLRGRNRAWACSPESKALGPVMAGQSSLEAHLQATASTSHASPDGQPSDVPGAKGRGMDGEGQAPDRARAPVSGQAESGRDAAAAVAGMAAPGVGADRTASRARRRERAGDVTWPVAALVGAVLLSTAVLWATRWPWDSSRLDLVRLVILAVPVALSQGLTVDVYGRGKLSISALLILASGVVFGMDGVLLLVPVAVLPAWVLRGGAVHTALLDLGSTTLSGAAAVVVYESLSAGLPGAQPVLLVAPAVLAALAYHVVSFGLSSLARRLGEKLSLRDVWRDWRECHSWVLPYYLAYGVLALLAALAYQAIGLYGLLCFLVPPLMLRHVMKQHSDRALESVAQFERTNHELLRAHDEAVATLRELRTTYDATLTVLSTALDTRDSDNEGHSRRVVEYAAAIARELGLSERDLPGLLNGALLHDVGKILVPDAILRKPGPLTPAERQAIKAHPEYGYHLLRRIGFLSDALPIIRHHHERYDGKGYPSRLRGTEIPLGARIIAVADAFETITSPQPYRAARSHQAARQEIARCAGSQFDPQVVQAFLRVDLDDLSRLGSSFVGRGSAARVRQPAEPEPEELTLVASAG